MKKNFKFGLGSVVLSSLPGELKIVNINKQLAIGNYPLENQLVEKDRLETIQITSFPTLMEMRNKIMSMNGPCILDFDEFTLDFTIFKQNSIDVVLRNIDKSLKMLLAC